MTERVYLLKQEGAGYFEKFFTSPYNAMARAARINRDLETSGFSPRKFHSEMFVLDIDDVPCDHVVVRDFVTGFANFVHSQTHEHGIALIEDSPCIYTMKFRGDSIAQIMVVYIPPVPGDVEDLGSPVLQILRQEETASSDKMQDLAVLLDRFMASW